MIVPEQNGSTTRHPNLVANFWPCVANTDSTHATAYPWYIWSSFPTVLGKQELGLSCEKGGQNVSCPGLSLLWIECGVAWRALTAVQESGLGRDFNTSVPLSPSACPQGWAERSLRPENSGVWRIWSW